jgi:hypothetical protein
MTITQNNDNNFSLCDNRVSKDKYLSVDSKPVLGPIEIVEKATEFNDIEKGKEYIREEFTKSGIAFGDAIQQGINALVSGSKANENVFDSDKCLVKLTNIVPSKEGVVH